MLDHCGYLESEKVDLLLVAGDVFDVPSHSPRPRPSCSRSSASRAKRSGGGHRRRPRQPGQMDPQAAGRTADPGGRRPRSAARVVEIETSMGARWRRRSRYQACRSAPELAGTRRASVYAEVQTGCRAPGDRISARVHKPADGTPPRRCRPAIERRFTGEEWAATPQALPDRSPVPGSGPYKRSGSRPRRPTDTPVRSNSTSGEAGEEEEFRGHRRGPAPVGPSGSYEGRTRLLICD